MYLTVPFRSPLANADGMLDYGLLIIISCSSNLKLLGKRLHTLEIPSDLRALKAFLEVKPSTKSDRLMSTMKTLSNTFDKEALLSKIKHLICYCGH